MQHVRFQISVSDILPGIFQGFIKMGHVYEASGFRHKIVSLSRFSN